MPRHRDDISEATRWILPNGSSTSNTSVLNLALLSPFSPNTPPKTADITKIFNISQTGITEWVLSHSPYTEASKPILLGNSSDGWNANTTFHLPSNATIDIILSVAKESMDKMRHQIHLHGHKFWVLASSENETVNLGDPGYRDTVDLPASGWVHIRYASFLFDRVGEDGTDLGKICD